MSNFKSYSLGNFGFMMEHMLENGTKSYRNDEPGHPRMVLTILIGRRRKSLFLEHVELV